MSQDLKYHRELQKALMELKQKDEDYRYAIEIGESLTKENQFLKEQVELLESQLHTQETDNDILKEKLETLSSTYHQDLYKYHQDLQAHKELVNELNKSLQSKNEELSQQKAINHKHVKQNNLNTRSAINKMARMTSDDMNNLTSSDFNSGLEKQLFLQLEKEKKKHVEDQQTIENLMKKLDDMMDLKKKYDQLKKANKELKQITKDELAQHIQMQKSIEAEAIYLAARKANLEEEREDLCNLLDQRDYEITMLNQQLQLQRKAATRTEHSQTLFGNQEATLGDDLAINEEGSMDNEYYYHDQDPDQPLSDEDEIDIIAEILDDEDIFDHEVFDDNEEGDDDDDDGAISKQPSLISEQMKQQSIIQNSDNNNNNNKATPKSPRTRRDEKKDDEESKDKKAFDKIKEYLHLTASAVKIKYPTVKKIQSDELIKRVKELPFYKYHDQMVRIMEAQLKKLRDLEKAKNQQLQTQEEFEDGPPPQLGKRRSFLSIFNIFGPKDDNQSDNEGFDDNKSDISDSEGPNDQGITQRKDRRKSKTRKKKRSFKKRKHRKSLSKESKERPDTNDNTPKSNGNNNGDFSYPTGGMSRNRRGISAEASQKRLKNNK
mmetsp:Transcript_7220/g.6462  ORF Transcript_7220/g.6462 Transcript_7220/m.6462 type:complete len:605 (+) Transcript_7220:358-2172(+)